MVVEEYVIGIDFGSDSVRALVVDMHTGVELASDVANYKRWAQGLYSNAALNQLPHRDLIWVSSMK
jgi:L-ribulokinase